MDAANFARFGFWSLALLNFAVVVVLALRGVRAIRRGEVARHRRSMRAACALVLGFLLAYVAKLALFGGESARGWSALERANLYVHEAAVFTMLACGAGAVLFARRFRPRAGADDAPRARLAHKRLGRVAVLASGAGLLTACGVFLSMFARAL